MKKVNFAAYETPRAEEIEMTINSIICGSGDGENDDYENGGNV